MLTNIRVILANSTDQGGAIYIEVNFISFLIFQNSQLEIQNCRFENNTAERGGALHIISKSNVTISDTSFFFNVGYDVGGAINIENESDLEMTNINGSFNFADNGGFLMFQSSMINVHNSTFFG